MVLAMEWVSRITTISLEMVLPALGGYWLDTSWGTKPLFTLLGAALGPAVGFWHLIRLAGSRPSSGEEQRQPRDPTKQ